MAEIDHFASRAEVEHLAEQLRQTGQKVGMDPDKKKFGKRKLMAKITNDKNNKGGQKSA